jgi:hypothetical protein
MKKSKYPLFRQLKANQTMTASIFWSECVTQFIGWFCTVILMLIVLSVTVQGSVERISQIGEYAALGLGLLWCIPVIRNTRYRLKDAGYGKKTYLWLLLPIIGWIIFIARLCAKSLPRKADGTFL